MEISKDAKPFYPRRTEGNNAPVTGSSTVGYKALPGNGSCADNNDDSGGWSAVQPSRAGGGSSGGGRGVWIQNSNSPRGPPNTGRAPSNTNTVNSKPNTYRRSAGGNSNNITGGSGTQKQQKSIQAHSNSPTSPTPGARNKKQNATGAGVPGNVGYHNSSSSSGNGPNSNSSDHDTASTDRQFLVQYLLALQAVADALPKINVDSDFYTNNERKALQSLSGKIEQICVIKLPHKQPSVVKEVAAAIMIFALLPAAYLTARDYASISRFVTRASLEKQLLLVGDEVIGLYRLLMRFLHKALNVFSMDSIGTAKDIAMKTTAATSSEGQEADDVLHEVLRAMAQLLLIRNEKLSRYRYEALACLVQYCTPRSQFSIDCRHAAVDGIGNLLKVPATQQCLLPHKGLLESFTDDKDMNTTDRLHLSEAQLQELESFLVLCHQRKEDIGNIHSLSPEARIGVYLRMRSEQLTNMQDIAVHSLLENLKLSSNQLMQFIPTAIAAGVIGTSAKEWTKTDKENNANLAEQRRCAYQFSLYTKLLVSCLRALEHALIAAQPSSPLALSQAASLTETMGANSATVSAVIRRRDSSQYERPYMGLNVESSMISNENAKGDKDIKGHAAVSFTTHIRSLTQSVHFLFSRMFPLILETAEMMSGRQTPKMSNSQEVPLATLSINQNTTTVVTAEHKLWQHALKLLSALARYDPLALMSTWSLFFTDTNAMDNQLIFSVNTMLTTLITQEKTKITNVDNPFLVLLPVTLTHPISTYVPSFQSPIFSSAFWAKQASIRAAAVNCIYAMISGLQISKWLRNHSNTQSSSKGSGGRPSNASGKTASGSLLNQKSGSLTTTAEKIPNTLIKICRVLILLLTVERDENVVRDILDCTAVLILHMGLPELKDVKSAFCGSDALDTESTGHSFTSKDVMFTSNNNAGNSNNSPFVLEMENLAWLMFRETMVIALENPYLINALRDFGGADAVAPASIGEEYSNISSIRGQNSSVHALNWLVEMCKKCPNLRCFSRALSLRTFSTGAMSPLEVRASSELSVAAAKASVLTNVVSTSDMAPALHHRSFMEVLGQLCITVSEPHFKAFASTAYYNACRQLQHLLVHTFPKLYLQDSLWLRTLIDSCREHSISSVRLLGMRITCTLLMLQQNQKQDSVGNTVLKPLDALNEDVGEDPDDPPEDIPPTDFPLEDEITQNSLDSNTSKHISGTSKVTMDTLVGVHTLLEVTTCLLLGARDSDHLIRAQAVGSFGQFSSECWAAMRDYHGFISVRQNNAMPINSHATLSHLSDSNAMLKPLPPLGSFNNDSVDTSVRAAVIQCLILACGDHVGTVRTAAQKSLGEAIVNGGLSISTVSKSSGPSPRQIFIISGTNALQARIDQAEQVRAEQLEHVESQAAAAAIEESYTPQQRLQKMRQPSLNNPQKQSTEIDLIGLKQDNTKLLKVQTNIANIGDATKSSKPVKVRRSHQIDTTITYSLPITNTSQGMNVLKGDLCLDVTSEGSYIDIVTAVLASFRDGCVDSKLGVRLQATWALGNLLLHILPHRQSATFPPEIAISSLSGNFVEAVIQDWLTDEVWLSLCELCMGLLEDSDKLLASTVRCLGFIAAGLSPWEGTHFGYLSAIVSLLIQKVLLSGRAGNIFDKEFDRLVQSSVEVHPHKLVFSVCQTLGYVGWVLVNRGDNDAGGVTPAVTACINSIRTVQAQMLRYGKLKVQLQACKVLVSEIHHYSTTSNSSNTAIPMHSGISLIDGPNSEHPRDTLSSSLYHNGMEGENREDANPLSFELNTKNLFGNDISHNEESIAHWQTRSHSLILALEACLVVVANSQLLDIQYAPGSIFYGKNSFSHENDQKTKSSKQRSTGKNVGIARRVTAITSSLAELSKLTVEKSRLSSLQRSLLVLLWVILRQACDMYSTSLFIEALSYHAESVSDWLALMADDPRVLLHSELSLTHEPLASTAPAEALPLACSPRSLVPFIARKYLEILRTENKGAFKQMNSPSRHPDSRLGAPHARIFAGSTSALTETSRIKLFALASLDVMDPGYTTNTLDSSRPISILPTYSALPSPVAKGLSSPQGSPVAGMKSETFEYKYNNQNHNPTVDIVGEEEDPDEI